MTDTITVNQVMFLHAAALEQFGGLTGVHDLNIIESAIGQ